MTNYRIEGEKLVRLLADFGPTDAAKVIWALTTPIKISFVLLKLKQQFDATYVRLTERYFYEFCQEQVQAGNGFEKISPEQMAVLVEKIKREAVDFSFCHFNRKKWEAINYRIRDEHRIRLEQAMENLSAKKH